MSNPNIVPFEERGPHYSAPAYAPQVEEDGGDGGGFSIGLTDLRTMAWRQRYIILGCIVAGLLIGLVVTFFMTPIYQATASVRIDQETSKIVEGQDLEPIASIAD